MKTIILVRHGESETNIAKVFTGQIDSLLTDTGRKQAKLMAEYVDKYKIEKIYSSPLRRAYDTACAILEKQNCPMEKYDELREIYAGKWEGMTFDDISKMYPQTYKIWREDIGCARPDDGESIKELYTRVVSKFKDIVSNSTQKTICIVAHALPIRVIESYIIGKSVCVIRNMPWVPNASVTVYNYDGGFKSVERGVCEYLGDMLTNLPKNI